MTGGGGRWDDLRARVLSGIAMIVVGLLGVHLGGYWFHGLIAFVCGLMVWELVRMLDAKRLRSAQILAAVAFVCAFVAVEVPPAFGLPLLLVPSMLGLGRMEQGGVTYAVYAGLVMIAGFGLMNLRDDFGVVWMAWLLMVVVVTDIAGYFAGRMIGGPKLWPRVSPKKTWSGSAAGWIGAALVGLAYSGTTQAGFGLIGLSVALSMASQIGDIAESAIKRRAGVKDSSTLIPGHGGLLDRFDGVLGAALMIVLTGQFTNFPPGVS